MNRATQDGTTGSANGQRAHFTPAPTLGMPSATSNRDLGGQNSRTGCGASPQAQTLPPRWEGLTATGADWKMRLDLTFCKSEEVEQHDRSWRLSRRSWHVLFGVRGPLVGLEILIRVTGLLVQTCGRAFLRKVWSKARLRLLLEPINLFAWVITAGLVMAAPVAADEFICPGGTVIVQGSVERAEAICVAAEDAKGQLASCNLPVTQTVTVEITRALPGNCFGLYSCEENLIQLQPLDAYADLLSEEPGIPFGHLEPEAFFNSILRHELAHAALDGMPCRFEACPATQEFVAYNMQIRFLSDSERAPFDIFVASTVEPVIRERINALVLAMSPEIFLRNAYAYLASEDDPCDLMAEIVRGEVLFDMPFQ